LFIHDVVAPFTYLAPHDVPRFPFNNIIILPSFTTPLATFIILEVEGEVSNNFPPF